MTGGTHRYDDIISLPHHVSKRHPPMPRAQRAAQFSPFAALTGYGDAVEEAARYTEKRVDLDEYVRAELDVRIRDALEHGLHIEIEYFVADRRKDGGAYAVTTGSIAKVDEHAGDVVLEGGQRIAIANIVSIRKE